MMAAGLASIATSVPYGLLTFKSSGHVWLMSGTTAAINVHVEIGPAEASAVESVRIFLSSGLLADNQQWRVEAALTQAADAPTDWKPLPADWSAGDPGCAPAQPCSRDYRLELRSTIDLTKPVLVPWSLTANVSPVRSYEPVTVTIGPTVAAPNPALVGTTAALVVGAIAFLMTVAVARWKGTQLIPEIERLSSLFLAIAAGALLLIALPAISGAALLLLGAAAAQGLFSKLERTPPHAPRVGMLAVGLPVLGLILTALQIAPAVDVLEIVLAGSALGATIGVGCASYARIDWWRRTVATTRDRLSVLVAIALVLLLVSGVLWAASIAIARDPSFLQAFVAVLLLVALRRWSKGSTVALSVLALLIAIGALATSFFLNRFGEGFFASVPPPPQPLWPSAYPLVIAALASLLVFLAWGRDPIAFPPEVAGADQA